MHGLDCTQYNMTAVHTHDDDPKYDALTDPSLYAVISVSVPLNTADVTSDWEFGTSASKHIHDGDCCTLFSCSCSWIVSCVNKLEMSRYT